MSRILSPEGEGCWAMKVLPGPFPQILARRKGSSAPAGQPGFALRQPDIRLMRASRCALTSASRSGGV